MRLWSLHPRYLDPQGLVALWRETLLARKVRRDPRLSPPSAAAAFPRGARSAVGDRRLPRRGPRRGDGARLRVRPGQVRCRRARREDPGRARATRARMGAPHAQARVAQPGAARALARTATAAHASVVPGRGRRRGRMGTRLKPNAPRMAGRSSAAGDADQNRALNSSPHSRGSLIMPVRLLKSMPPTTRIWLVMLRP